MDPATLDQVRIDPDRAAAARRVLREHPGWYHTLELTEGVTTPGLADLRPLLPRALPRSLAGLRCLDVGTFDGLYAFAMEERGAREVLAIDVADPADLDHPPLRRADNLATVRESGIYPGDGFRAAAAARRSAAQWLPCNVYDLSPNRVGGPVDFAVVSTILQHLRDPVGALERVREALVPGGEVVIIETFLPRLGRGERPLLEFRAAMPGSNYTWMVPNLAALKAWVVAAELELLPGAPYRHRLSRGGLTGRGGWLAVIRARRPVSAVAGGLLPRQGHRPHRGGHPAGERPVGDLAGDH